MPDNETAVPGTGNVPADNKNDTVDHLNGAPDAVQNAAAGNAQDNVQDAGNGGNAGSYQDAGNGGNTESYQDQVSVGIDQVHAVTANVMQDKGVGGKGEGNADDPFDDLNELVSGSYLNTPAAGGGPGGGGPGGGDGAADDQLAERRQRINNLRSKNLYKAVVLWRMLKRNDKNPLADSRLRRAAHIGHRIFDNSVMDTVADANKVLGGIAGMGAALDKDKSHSSGWTLTSLVSNGIALITSLKDGIFKIKKLFPIKPFKFQKFILGLGILNDFLITASKACSIIKTVLNYTGVGALPKMITDYTALLLNFSSQSIGLFTGALGLKSGVNELSKLKKDKKETWEKVKAVVARKLSVSEEEAEKWNNTKRRKQAANVLKDMKADEEGYDYLVMYLAYERRQDKKITDLTNASTGLVVSLLGMFSSVATAANYISNGDTLYGGIPKDATAAKVAKYAGVAASGGAIVVGSAKIVNRAASKGSQAFSAERKSIKEGLVKKLEVLAADNFGLKRMAEHITQTDNEAIEHLDGLYNQAEPMFSSAGVPYQRLLKAPDIKAFEKLLVAGV